jgi:hypothetical protein
MKRDLSKPLASTFGDEPKGRSLKAATATPKHFVTTKLDVTDNFYNGKFTGSKIKKEGYNVPIGQTGPLSPNQLIRDRVVVQKAAAKNKKEERRKDIYKKVDAKMAAAKKK